MEYPPPPSQTERGQVIVEYLLGIVIAVSIIGVISGTFRRTLFGLWSQLTKEVAAGCPNCQTQQKFWTR